MNNYTVRYDAEENEYVGKCDEYPSLSHGAATPTQALNGIIRLIHRFRVDNVGQHPTELQTGLPGWN